MTIVIRIEFRNFDQIVTSVSFGPKNGNPPEMLELWRRLCVKRLHWQSCRLGSSYIFMKYDVFRQNADLFKELSWSALNNIHRRLLGLPWKCSASVVYTNYDLPNLDTVKRRNLFGFIQFVGCHSVSQNFIVRAIEQSWRVIILLWDVWTKVL